MAIDPFVHAMQVVSICHHVIVSVLQCKSYTTLTNLAVRPCLTCACNGDTSAAASARLAVCSLAQLVQLAMAARPLQRIVRQACVVCSKLQRVAHWCAVIVGL